MTNPETLKELEIILKENLNNEKGFSLHYLMLFSIIIGMEAKKVFEFGCGFSSKTILSALQITDGHLTTCDQRPINKTGNNENDLNFYKKRWKYIEGKSADKLKEVKGPFEVVLHDGAHDLLTVARDIWKIKKHIKQNGLLLVHDTNHPKLYTMKLAVTLGLIFTKHEKVTLPYGCGLTIIRIKGNKKIGKVKLTWKKSQNK